MLINPNFPDEEFNAAWDGTEGRVFAFVLNPHELRWTVDPGTRHDPERHTHGHLLLIESGHGRIRVGDLVLDYKEGWSFWIAAGVSHNIEYAISATLVHQINDDYKLVVH